MDDGWRVRHTHFQGEESQAVDKLETAAAEKEGSGGPGNAALKAAIAAGDRKAIGDAQETRSNRRGPSKAAKETEKAAQRPLRRRWRQTTRRQSMS
jgi:hypothetical protein